MHGPTTSKNVSGTLPGPVANYCAFHSKRKTWDRLCLMDFLIMLGCCHFFSPYYTSSKLLQLLQKAAAVVNTTNTTTAEIILAWEKIRFSAISSAVHDLDHAFQVLEISFQSGDLPHQQYSIDCLTSASPLFVHVHLCTTGNASLRCKI